MKPRALVLGLVAALAWIGAAGVSFDHGLQPVRPLYDGTHTLPPYAWVKPPPSAAAENQPPTPTKRTFALTPGKRSRSESIASADAQASIIFVEGGIVVPPGATGVELTITPSDPAPLGVAGLKADGNAVTYEAVYLPSREPVRLTSPCPEATRCGTVILRYPLYGKKLFRRDGDAWVEVPGSQSVPSGDQVYANVDSLGTFVAAGVPPAGPRDDGFVNVLALGLGIAAVVAAVFLARYAPSRRKRSAGKRPIGKKR